MRISVYNFFVWSLIFFWIGMPMAYAQEKKKQVENRYEIKVDTKIEISNKHGDVIINNWDKNALELKVTISAEGRNESATDKILDAITINIKNTISSGRLEITTDIGDEMINKNSKFSIQYEINMPRANPLKLSNNFGNVFMESRDGRLDVAVKYGQLQAEDLNYANVRVEFASAKCEIEVLKSGSIDLRYSKMAIEEVGDVEIESQFSDLEIESAGDVKLDGKYGEFSIEHIKSLTADIQFAGLSIEFLGENLKLATRHGNGIDIEQISKDFKVIQVDSQFSSLDLNLESGAESTLYFDLDFGNLKANGDGINFTKVVKENTHSSYEGYLGKASAASSISISSKHGNIRLDVD